jgi:xanthine dehydrogenase FAD-binding subunit
VLTCDDYLTPTSLDDALELMTRHTGRQRIVAGATDILPWAREGRAGDVHVPNLIDISKVAELNEVSFSRGRVRLGAATPFQRFLDRDDLVAAMPNMRHCAIWFADDQIRECATIGGNLANASPAADGTPPFLALNAEIELARLQDGKTVRRRMPLSQFITGPGGNQLVTDELIVAVECDALPGYGGSFEKVGHRRSLVIAVACVSALVSLDRDGRHFDDVRLAVGGVGPKALRLADVEALLRGAPIDARVIDEASRLPLDLVQSRTRQAYRREVFRGFVSRALAGAARDAGADVNAVEAELEVHHA